jgi:hypothetical protein
MPPTEECRLAKVEQRVESLCRELTEDKADEKEKIKDIYTKVNAINVTLGQQNVKWSVIAVVATAASTLAIAFIGKFF